MCGVILRGESPRFLLTWLIKEPSLASIYIASKAEGEGKTAVVSALASEFKRQGKTVAVFKPVAAAGTTSDSDPDVESYSRLLDQKIEAHLLDHEGGAVTDAWLNDVKSAYDNVAGGVDVVLIEGSCSLTVDDAKQVVDILDARMLVVARYRRELSAVDLRKWKEDFGDRLGGIVINGLTRHLATEMQTNLLSPLETEGLNCLGVVPEDRRLLGVSVAQLAKHLDARFVICEENSDALVEHLMVGGLGIDSGELYFGMKENKAVVVRGDRPDIQMASLGTPTSCMVLTNGIEPIEYIRYEAEQEEVPVMVVQTDTLGTMDALNGLESKARFDHKLKLDRFDELFSDHVDIGQLSSEFGLAD